MTQPDIKPSQRAREMLAQQYEAANEHHLAQLVRGRGGETGLHFAPAIRAIEAALSELNLSLETGDGGTLTKAMVEIKGHADMANEVIRLGKGTTGNSRVKVATCLHHIGRIADAALSTPARDTAQEETLREAVDQHGLWQPRIGAEVRVSDRCLYYGDWQHDRLWVAGVAVDRGGDGLNITVAHEWPQTSGGTDGFMINRPFKPDDLEPVAGFSLASSPMNAVREALEEAANIVEASESWVSRIELAAEIRAIRSRTIGGEGNG